MSYNIIVCGNCSDGITDGVWDHLPIYYTNGRPSREHYKAAQKRLSNHAPLKYVGRETVHAFWPCELCRETVIIGDQFTYNSHTYAKTTKMIKKDPVVDENKLQKHVRCFLNRTAKGYSTGVEGVLHDLSTGGCVAGFVSHLIYYHETDAFYKKFSVEISSLVGSVTRCTGWSIPHMLGGQSDWDDSDPLCAVEQGPNRNLLAWWAFEESAKDICRNAGVKLI